MAGPRRGLIEFVYEYVHLQVFGVLSRPSMQVIEYEIGRELCGAMRMEKHEIRCWFRRILVGEESVKELVEGGYAGASSNLHGISNNKY